MQKFIFTTILSIFGLFVLTQNVHAATIGQTINRTLEFQGDVVKVKEVLSTKINDPRYQIPAGSEITFRIFNPIVNDEKASQKVKKTLPTIKVKELNGTNIPFTTKIEGQDIIIQTKFLKTIRETASKIQVTYDSYSLTSQTGAVYDLYIPSFKEGFEFETESHSLDVKTKVIIPKSYGEFNFITPEKTPLTETNNWVINFDRDDLTGVISWIQIGTKQFYQFEIRQPYSASSEINLFSNQYEVLLPRNVSAGPLTQTVYYDEISPEPTSTRLDNNGNLVAKFSLPANESGEIVVSGYVEIAEDNQVDITNSGSISDIPPTVLGENIASTKFWESDSPAIVNVALDLKQDTDNVYQIMQNTYDYVVNLIDYSEVKRFGINERQGALKTLQGGAAVCMEYSDLFIALMRAQGIPARAAFGYGYDSRSTNGIDTAHQWAEIYVPSISEWVLVDTTWGESGPSVVGGDLNHFYKYVASSSPLEPSPVSVRYFGDLAEISEESFEIKATNKALSGDFITQEELLTKYPEQGESSGGFSFIFSSLIDQVSDLNARVDNSLLVNFNIQDQNHRQVLRFIIYTVPFLLIVTIILLARLLRAEPKKDKIE